MVKIILAFIVFCLGWLFFIAALLIFTMFIFGYTNSSELFISPIGIGLIVLFSAFCLYKQAHGFYHYMQGDKEISDKGAFLILSPVKIGCFFYAIISTSIFVKSILF